MDTKDILNKEFFAQDFSEGQPYAKTLNRYKEIACNYSQMENAIAVLSDWRTNESYIYYGGFLQMLGIDKNVKESKVASIWEEEIFRIIHLMIWPKSTYKNYVSIILSSGNPKRNVPTII